MPRSTLKTRIILIFVVILVACAAVMAVWAGTSYSRIAMDNAQRRLLAQARLASALAMRRLSPTDTNMPMPPPDADLQSLSDDFSQGPNTYLTVLDAQGDVVVSSTGLALPNQAEQPEVVAALAGRMISDTRYDPAQRQTMMFTALPVRRPGRLLGIVQLSMPMAAVEAEIRSFWLRMGLITLVVAIAGALAGAWLAGQIVRPVRRLRDAAAELAAGNLDERVPEGETGEVIEIGQLAVAFNHMAGRIQEMMDRQRAFVANASHELRTPVTNIKLRAEALGDGALDDPAVAPQFVNEIESEADRLGRLASDLLTLSQHDAAPGPAREPVDAAVLAREVAGQMALRAEKAGVALDVTAPPGLPPIWADRDGLCTILVNLLDNALQYTPRGGRVALRFLNDEADLVLEVADTGAGIPPEDLPHVFERFYRADRARSRRTAVTGSGAGLGLAIVQGIVKEHGGTVAVHSTIGQGTVVTVRLPRVNTPRSDTGARR